MTTLAQPKMISQSSIDIFRPIHYLGSKLRVVSQINEIVSELYTNKSSVVCDLFSGSGTVSNYLASSFPVLANDIQEYSKIINMALLCEDSSSLDIESFIEQINKSSFNELTEIWNPIINLESHYHELSMHGDSEGLCEIIEKGSYAAYKDSELVSTEIKKTFSDIENRLKNSNFELSDMIATSYFGGVYFSYTQALQLDIILNEIKLAPEKHKNTLKAALLSTSSDIVNTIGKHFAQPIRPRTKEGKPKKYLAKSINKDRTISVIDSFASKLSIFKSTRNNSDKNSVVKKDFIDVLKNDISENSVIYADPPYTRDHYSRFYHVLETLSIQDTPAISTTTIRGATTPSRGIYREDRHQSPFCIKSQAPKAFDHLFRLSSQKNSSLIISYSPFDKDKAAHPRVMDIDNIISIGKKYYKNITTVCAGNLRHSKLNASALHLSAADKAEIFIIATN